MNIRRETPNDDQAIYHINRQAFGREMEAELPGRLRESGAVVLSLVAEMEGELVGHILFSPLHVETESGPVQGLGLGPVAVLPEYQRRGIGGALLEAGLEICRQEGHAFVVLVGHPDYYPRFGFERAGGYGLRMPFEVPDEAFMVMALQPGALEGVSGVVQFHPAFGEGEEPGV